MSSDYNYAGEFKKKYNFEQRNREASRVRQKYPDRIPIIVEQEKTKSLPLLDKRKYLVPENMTVGQFMYVLRKRLKITPDKALYIFFGSNLEPNNSELSRVYEKHREPDMFLYATIGAEKTFGNNLLRSSK